MEGTSSESQVQSNLNPNEVPCPLCPRKFNYKKSLNRHLRNDHQPDRVKKHTCSLCPNSYYEKSRLMKHLFQKHKISTGYNCLICKKSFQLEESLLKHNALKHPPSEYVCTRCSTESFHNRNDLVQHMFREHQISAGWDCALCNSTFQFRRDLTSHVRTSHPDQNLDVKRANKYWCATCNMGYVNQTKYHMHLFDKHNISAGWDCNACHRTYQLEENLLRHNQMHHSRDTNTSELLKPAELVKTDLAPIEFLDVGKNPKMKKIKVEPDFKEGIETSGGYETVVTNINIEKSANEIVNEEEQVSSIQIETMAEDDFDIIESIVDIDVKQEQI